MKRTFVLLLAAGTLAISSSAALAGGNCSSGAKASQASNRANIVETAAEAGTFNTLLAAAKAAGLADLLSSEGPFTVFAPTDDAFAKLPAGTVATLLEPENKHQLVAILKYHVISGEVYADEAITAGRAKTANGERLRFRIKDGRLRVNDAIVVANDVQTENGVIHVIDSVLLPGE